jgi:hypothetical protein
MQIDSSHTFYCHTVSFRFVVFVYLDNNVLPEGNLPSHFALNVYQLMILSYFEVSPGMQSSPISPTAHRQTIGHP